MSSTSSGTSSSSSSGGWGQGTLSGAAAFPVDVVLADISPTVGLGAIEMLDLEPLPASNSCELVDAGVPDGSTTESMVLLTFNSGSLTTPLSAGTFPVYENSPGDGGSFAQMFVKLDGSSLTVSSGTATLAGFGTTATGNFNASLSLTDGGAAGTLSGSFSAPNCTND